ncbi:GldG family protein [Nitrosomonas sp. ANs5]|uniref:GldG family protein n=1 Tax=Nitrosomonas sp. ANs5 TaxID=3423941 RepID=UPI003D35631E
MAKRKRPHQPRYQTGSGSILLGILMVLLGLWALEYRMQWDITQNGRNSLSQASVDLLQKLDGPVQVTVYATAQDAQLGDVRGTIRNFIGVYQRIKPDLMLDFIDPVEQPQLAQDAGVKLNGEMVVRFNQRSARLAAVNEQAFTNTLLRLARTNEKRLLALSGHGERKLDGVAQRDLGNFGGRLEEIGFKTESFNFADEVDVPRDASVLMIASPQIDLLAGEIDQLLDYLARGGNLLWLVDVGSLRGLLPLAERLGIVLTPGVIVDPQAKRLRAPPTFALGSLYGPHAVTENFDYLTVFPYARQLILEQNREWFGTVLVEAAPQGWVETGEISDEVSFDADSDVAGPVSVAVALSRIVDDREQRVIVVGSGHFLANSHLGNGGNLDFGINMVNWLAGDESLIAIQPPATVDSQLVLSEWALTVIVVIFLIMLPLVFVASGIFVSWYRKRR